MSNLTFPDFTAETSPLLADYLVGYRTNISGGERRTALTDILTLFRQAGVGDVVGPSSATAGALARWDGTTGKLLQDSPNFTTTIPSGTVAFQTVLSKPSGAAAVLNYGASDGNFTFLDSTTVNAGTAVPLQLLIGGNASAVFSPTAGITLTALGTNQNIALNPSGSGALTTTSASFTVPDAFVLSSAGSISLTAGGSNKNITLTPSGAGFVSVVGSGIRIDGTADSLTAWGLTGPIYSSLARTITDSASSGTVATAVANSLGIPTFAAGSVTTFTNAANLYIAGDVAAGTNVTLTDSYGLWNAGKTRIDDNLRQYMFATTKDITFRRAQGSSSSPTILVSGNAIGKLGFDGYNGSGYTTVASISASSAENWVAATSYATDIIVNNTNTGSTSSGEQFRIKYWGGHLLGVQTSSLSAWGLNGPIWRDNGNTANMIFTDTTSSGTVATAVGFRHSNPQFAASSVTTFTDAASVYIAGDARASTNVTLTNTYGLWNVGKTRLDGNLLNTGTTVHNFGATALGNIGVSADTTAGVLQIKSPTSGTITLTTANALSLTVSGGAAATITGGAGNMTIVSGTGASRTLVFQTTTSGSTATTALTLSATQTATFAGSITTSAPNTGTAGAWKLGILVTTTSVFDTTKYVQLDVGGTLYKLATCT